MNVSTRILLPLLILALIAGCNGKGPDKNPDTTAITPQPPPPAAPSKLPVAGFEVVKTFPHDTAAFTEGLLFHDGALFESTGLNDSSSIRKVELETGKVLRKTDMASEYFGEGLTLVNGKLYQLTWRNGVGFVYDMLTFQPADTFRFYGEGWGLTTDGTQIFMSDGTEFIRVLDAATLEVRRVLPILAENTAVRNLNELEYIKGELWANVWQTDRIARIDPATGAVKGWIDLTNIFPASERTRRVDVLNGIAYDAAGDRVFVTGKFWPKLYQIRLKDSLPS